MISPLFFEKTKDGEAMYDLSSRLLKDRIIFLSGEMDDDVGTLVTQMLIALESQNHKEISLYIKSMGGVLEEALFPIFDTMNSIKSPIKTVCVGCAYSAAATILAAGTPGRRFAQPNSEIMIHDISTGIKGPAHSINKDAKRIKSINDRHILILSKLTGKTIKDVAKMCKEETFFLPEEAIKAGLIDHIVEKSEDISDF